MNPERMPYTRSVSPILTGQNRCWKVGANWRFQAGWASQPMGCLLYLDLPSGVTQAILHNCHYVTYAGMQP